MSNPYSSPTPPQPPSAQQFSQGDTGGASFVSLVKTVAIMMIVLGSLELLFALLALGGLVLALPGPNANNGLGAANIAQNEGAMILMWLHGGLIAIYMAVSILRIVAGIRNLSFRSYWLGVVSHFVGIPMVMLCCVPLSIALCIFGCLVYFQASVKEAFQMATDGRSAEQIRAYFAQVALGGYVPPK